MKEPGTNARQKFDVYPVGTEEDPIELVADDPDERIELPIAAQLSSTRDVDNGYDWVYDLQVTYDSGMAAVACVTYAILLIIFRRFDDYIQRRNCWHWWQSSSAIQQRCNDLVWSCASEAWFAVFM